MGSTQRVLRTEQLSRVLIDISTPYSATIPVWPGDVAFSCGWTARREQGSSVNLATLTSSAHAGTHADAPLHVESDWAASESLPARVFVGGVRVIALPTGMAADAVITRALLEELLDPPIHLHRYVREPSDVVPTSDTPISIVPSRLLCRTGQSVSRGVFPDAWPVLSDDAARWLVQSGLLLWGTDAPSVDARTSTSLPVHHILFNGGAYVLENLALDGVAPGRYELLAQPIAVVGADAAPVRAMLRTW